MFPDMPWMLGGDLAEAVRAATRDAWPTGGPYRGRLFAFGFDAFRLAQALRHRWRRRQHQHRRADRAPEPRCRAARAARTRLGTAAQRRAAPAAGGERDRHAHQRQCSGRRAEELAAAFLRERDARSCNATIAAARRARHRRAPRGVLVSPKCAPRSNASAAQPRASIAQAAAHHARRECCCSSARLARCRCASMSCRERSAGQRPPSSGSNTLSFLIELPRRPARVSPGAIQVRAGHTAALNHCIRFVRASR